MTSRRNVLGLMCLAPFAARAQQGRRVYRVGVLETTSLRANTENFDRFRKGMEERGYVEGPSLVMAYRSADGRTERFAQLAGDLVRSKVDLILTRGTPATLAAKRATADVPVVMAAVSDPVESGLAASLGRPGGNVTGLTSSSPELIPKRLEMLKALVPKMSRLAVYANLDNLAAQSTWKDTDQAARSMGLEALLLDVRSPEKIAPAFDEAVRGRADALLVGIETVAQSNVQAIVELAAKHKLPALYAARDFVDAGGLVSYGVNYADLYYRAAGYADRILKGAKPGELPIGQPAKFSLSINRRAANALGVVIPPDLVLRSDWTID
jgi:putative ABC transport system substrate-binding protein